MFNTAMFAPAHAKVRCLGSYRRVDGRATGSSAGEFQRRLASRETTGNKGPITPYEVARTGSVTATIQDRDP